jgi:hypothetical protein
VTSLQAARDSIRVLNVELHSKENEKRQIEAPKDVEPTLFQPQLFQDGVQAIFQNIPLHQLAAVRFTKT